MDLPHLKPATATSNAKYRRRVPENLRGVFKANAVEWSLKTKDPKEVIDAWKLAHARFEAMAERGSTVSSDQIKWEMAQKAAIEHGLASPRDTQIGPVDPEGEHGRFTEFTQAILTEADRVSPQQMNAALSNSPAATPFDVLLEAKLKGIARPAVTLQDAAKEYLKDREARATYDDISKQVGLVIRGVGEAVDQKNPTLEGLTLDDAYLYRDGLRDKGNSIGTIERRMNTVNAVLNHAKKRHRLTGWENPFAGMELPKDDGVAGETKRASLTLTEIKKTIPFVSKMNEDAQGIWLLMMFTGAGPNELRGLMWNEVDLKGPTPSIEIRANKRRRLKTGERPRRVPLVGAALSMMKAKDQTLDVVFPRYAVMKNSNSLSAVLIKMMKASEVWEKVRRVPYSLRHTLKDHLRRVAPTTFQLLIFGHGHGEGGSADGYGGDDLLDMQADYLTKAVTLLGVYDYPLTVYHEDATRSQDHARK